MKLDPCPFCGNKTNLAVVFDDHGVSCRAVCFRRPGKGCGASTDYYPTIGQAVEAWNRRAER